MLKPFLQRSLRRTLVATATATSKSTQPNHSNKRFLFSSLTPNQLQLHPFSNQHHDRNQQYGYTTQSSQLNTCSSSCGCNYPNHFKNGYSSVTPRFYSPSSTTHSKQTDNHDNESTNRRTEDNTKIDTSKTASLSEISTSDLKLAMDVAQQPQDETNPQTTTTDCSPSSTLSIHLDDIPGTGSSFQKPTRQLAIIYTCNVCNTRSAKKFTERAYNHGVVMVRCPSCESLHLIADRLGYFPDDYFDGHDGDGANDEGNGKKGWDIEKFMKQIGREDNIKIVTGGEMNDVLEVTLEDVLGDKLKMNANVDEHEKEKG